MYDPNQTRIAEILLLGFQNTHHLKALLFTIFLLVYSVTLTGNLVIVVLVSVHRRLHTPMYFFLSLLSSSEVISTSNIVPKMLSVILKDGDSMSFSACLTQFYIFSAITNSECFLLTVMSFDRYLAICYPLRYISIMDFKLQLNLAVWSWIISLMVTLFITLLVYNLQFCGPNVIDHFFCDLAPILHLSCSDTTVVKTQAFIFSVPVIVLPCIFIVVTYIFISFAILRISSHDKRQKAFSTCSSHLAVVGLYYGTLISVYLSPTAGHSPSVSKVLSLLYIIVTPLFNPIIYSLRNQEIRMALRKSLHKTTYDINGGIQ
ncbi:PREDICTED: olfactory receptor 11L1-like [Nanorana parkeri]|uniref:olfactory receptor 11L1-like n=1 Tax=Nanorana parkeri TaxID=125878 RepID=UPI0008545B67|nr:PREDICTED: olfactory receptor 11L1-like [Nanorana parkeri]